MKTIYHSGSNDLTHFFQPIRPDPVVGHLSFALHPWSPCTRTCRVCPMASSLHPYAQASQCYWSVLRFYVDLCHNTLVLHTSELPFACSLLEATHIFKAASQSMTCHSSPPRAHCLHPSAVNLPSCFTAKTAETPQPLSSSSFLASRLHPQLPAWLSLEMCLPSSFCWDGHLSFTPKKSHQLGKTFLS